MQFACFPELLHRLPPLLALQSHVQTQWSIDRPDLNAARIVLSAKGTSFGVSRPVVIKLIKTQRWGGLCCQVALEDPRRQVAQHTMRSDAVVAAADVIGHVFFCFGLIGINELPDSLYLEI